MGFLTTITIYNDEMESFEKDPEGFGKAILNGINKANCKHKSVDVHFCNSSPILVQPSQHASDTTVYLHYGNTMFHIDEYGKEFNEICLREDKSLAEDIIKEAKNIIERAAALLKKFKAIDKNH